MQVLKTRLDTRSDAYQANRAAMEQSLAEFEKLQAEARLGGGEKYVRRHRERGKLLARERIELLVDRDSPFLELSPLAAWDTAFAVGASVVTGIGVVAGVEWLRAFEIARANRLPVIQLTESGGADLPNQAEIFVPGGRTFFEITRLSAERIPTLSLVFGSCTAGGAYVPGMSDYTIFIKERSKVFLA